jgi:hypothetical protein
MRRPLWFGAALLTLACATLTSHGARVEVFQAPLSETESPAAMPRGCRFLAAHPPVDMSEREMLGVKDPYRIQRDRAGQAGGNVLLVRSRIIVSRRDLDCPAAAPITDCPRSDGSWSRVVFEDYACSADALARLRAVGSAR